MTTLLAWLSVDSLEASAINIVTDSRITWGSSNQRWDSGTKVFTAATPDIFAYCGDVVFPSIILGQLTDLASRGVLWDQSAEAIKRHEISFGYFKTSFSRQHNAPNRGFTIVHAARDGLGKGSKFSAWQTEYDAADGSWRDMVIDTSHDQQSKEILRLGSGIRPLEREVARWNSSPQSKKARAFFSAFCDTLFSGADALSGGMPQLASLDRTSSGKIVGFSHEDNLYLHGVPVAFLPSFESIEWRDAKFQMVSPKTMKPLSGAQRYEFVPSAKNGGFKDFFNRSKKVDPAD